MKFLKQDDIGGVCEILEKGKIAAVPTETVYGLAVKYDSHKGLDGLIKLKDRELGSGKYFALMVARVEDMENYVEMSKEASELAQKHLPGELTLVLPRKKSFNGYYFKELEEIGVRIPDNEFMLRLLRQAGPLAVTSANLRGEEPAKNSEEASELEVGAVVIGEAGGSLPSTVARIVRDEVEVLRQGGLKIS